ncbi:CCA tRNA nucleotidyltransferase [Aureliella helgolandensis]|uniref:tRNA nucleotidyltransferase/poly(A) polymerase n=1 Tax=Aureliella helgolandensis TaxID=2527968 RepID=A0A518GDJ3_9BACT|nr:CCA tRNA nucleotidyltransferase [Aureliella helgolandensis]QDV26618.1 tRNA nucleotidyltransferase/poly(A) polymerase [Aureliella helgolandensis]
MSGETSRQGADRSRTFALEVVTRLRNAGFEALWAGGCVRDLLMGNVPTDYDVATSATPEAVRALFGKSRTLPVGLAFGVVIVLPSAKGADPIEVATFRTETSYSDGRHPDSVEYSTAEFDAQRRDFTINGMFYDPLSEKVLDFVGGNNDLERRVVRAIGTASDRIAEDKLRMLRAIRFAARFGFELDPQTRQAIGQQATQIDVVSGERVASELRKMLLTDRPAWGMQMLFEVGLLGAIFPELQNVWPQASEKVRRLLQALADWPLARPEDDVWKSRLAGMLWPFVGCRDIPSDHTAPMRGTGDGAQGTRPLVETRELLKTRLKLSNDELVGIDYALRSQQFFEQAGPTTGHLPWSVLQPWLIHPQLQTGWLLFQARATVEPHLQGACEWIDQKLNQSREQLDPPPLITGQTLIELGMRPNPAFRDLLAAVRAQQLDRQLTSPEAALEWIQSQRESFGPDAC